MKSAALSEDTIDMLTIAASMEIADLSLVFDRILDMAEEVGVNNVM